MRRLAAAVLLLLGSAPLKGQAPPEVIRTWNVRVDDISDRDGHRGTVPVLAWAENLPAAPSTGQTHPAVGRWKAVFVGPMGPRPQMVSAVTFTIASSDAGFTATAKTEPEWPGELEVSDLKLEGDTVSFSGTGKSGWAVNGEPHCCPKLKLAGTVTGDTMRLTLTWVSTERPDAAMFKDLAMEATRVR